MVSSLYSEARPLGMLLRRMLADGCPIAEVPAEVSRVLADGEIELPGNQRLPSEWWLVQLASGRLSIETDDPDRPLDPNQFLYRERCPPPPAPIVIQSAALIARRAKGKVPDVADGESIGSAPEPIIEVKPEPLKRPSAKKRRRRPAAVAKTVKALRSTAAAERAADKAKREADALKWASDLSKAKLDAPKARAYVEAECKKRFGIGSHIVRTRIWPEARAKKRLPERALSGPRLPKK